MDSTNSAFKMPMVPQPQPSQAETLLFNDILEEKTLALRSLLSEFLQVQPYRKFDIEFSNFLKRTKQIVQEGHRIGANVSRITNSSQIAPVFARPSASLNYRPSASLNYRPSASLSMVSSSRNSTLGSHENNFQPIESLNPFKPPGNMSQQRLLLPRIEQSICAPQNSSASCATVNEVNQNKNESCNSNNNENHQPREPSERPQSVVPYSYSDMTMSESKSVAGSQQQEMENDGSNSIESLFEEVGFKIVLGLPDNNNKSFKQNNKCQHQSDLMENVIKHLSMWSINMKQFKPQNVSKFALILTGTLMEKDRVTVKEKRHDAGILEVRKENNLVKTKNGIYRLVGNIISGSPNELYQACLSICGIPRTWKNIVKKSTSVDKNSKNDPLNFSLRSPDGPIKEKKTAADLNTSKTRKGTMYNANISHAVQRTNGKRKCSNNDATNNIKTKHRKFHELPPLLASTPKRPKIQLPELQTPTQILKNKLHQTITSKTRDQTLNTINDSINVAKKRQSFSKEQINILLKPEASAKTSLNSNNSTKHNKLIGSSSMSRVHSTKESKQTSIHNSNILNSVKNSDSQSKSKMSQNSSAMSNNLNSSEQPTKLKSSINSTKNITDCINYVSKQISPEKVKPIKNVKCVKQKENHTLSPKILLKKNCLNLDKLKTSNCSKRQNNKKPKENAKKDKTNKEQSHGSKGTLVEYGLFDVINAVDYDDTSDYNVMASPGKLSVISRTDKSRSETPPLFGNQWSSTAKSVVVSEPPSPLSKSVEAKALKRIKAPKLTREEKIKYIKGKNNKQSLDYTTVSKKINKMLEFGEQYDADDD